MLTEAELALFRRYGPLVEAELDRLGISAADQRWILNGTDQRPTEAAFDALLSELRALPTDYGPVAFCEWLGFDYLEARAELSGLDELGTS